MSKDLSLSFHVSCKNHAIRSKVDLARVINHDYNLYSGLKAISEKSIVSLLGSSTYNDIMRDITDLYHIEFDESVLKYNKKQRDKGHPERCIDDYFDKVADDDKSDLGVECILQLGDLDFWKDYSIEDQKRIMPDIYNALIEELQTVCPDFKIVSAALHVGEKSEDKDANGEILSVFYGSPHVHILGVPVSKNCSRGMDKQAVKTKVFTKDSLKKIQEALHKKADEVLKGSAYFGKDFSCKTSEEGRNQNLSPAQIKAVKKAERKIDKRYREKIDELEETVKEQADYIDKQDKQFKELFSIADAQKTEIKSLQEKSESQKKTITNYELALKQIYDIFPDFDGSFSDYVKMIKQLKNQAPVIRYEVPPEIEKELQELRNYKNDIETEKKRKTELNARIAKKKLNEGVKEIDTFYTGQELPPEIDKD